MNVNREVLNFYSYDTTDIVVGGDTVSFTNDGVTSDPEQAKIQTNSIPNPYGKQCFIRYKWSLDGTNFNSAITRLLYSFIFSFISPPSSSPPVQALQAAVSCGTDAENIYFVTGNGYHGNATFATPSTPTAVYTPIAQTFTIEYVLFEIGL